MASDTQILGCIIQVIYNYYPAASTRWVRLFAFNRAMLASGGMTVVGIALLAPLVIEYVRCGLRLPPLNTLDHPAVTGLFLLIAAFLTFSTTLVLNASMMRLRPRRRK